MAIPISPADVLEQHSHLVAGKLRITEHFFQVPRDHAHPASGKLTLFARSAEKHEQPADPVDVKEAAKKKLPWLVYLQGGPGFGCRPPHHLGWVHTVLDRGYRVLLLDQRGTGMSTPLTAHTLGLRGDDKVQAEYLRFFRADSIVRDCEAVRLAVTADMPEEKRKWSVMGQSFGGYCITTYLSFYPEGVREAFVFGGLPPVHVTQPDVVYRKLLPRQAARNEVYYSKYPEDVERVKRIISFLRRFGEESVRLPSGGVLSARRFLQLGIGFGFHGGIDGTHDIVLRCATDLEQFGSLTRPALATIEAAQPFDDAIIYAALHEPLYCQGEGTAPSWSAERMWEEDQRFQLDTDGPIYFTGETIHPFMFKDYAELSRLAGPAQILAQQSTWDPVYDVEQLAKNEVPMYCAVYMHDTYVDFDYSMDTASKIKGCHVFVSNLLYHDAIRSRMEETLRNVFALRDDILD